MTVKDGTRGTTELKALVASDPDFVRVLVRTALQEVLEAEMSETLGAAKGERTPGRLGYRAGHYGRTLVTRVGKLELRVPQDREAASRPSCSSATSARSGRWWRRWPRCTSRACRPGR
jgi:transposase-like protein